jgi:hypothetical protein
MILDRLPPSLLSCGRPLLAELGVDELAWRRDDALAVIDSLDDAVAVLGGDVYVERGGRLRADGASWSCERRTGESMADFALRSRRQASEYIARFRIAPDTATFFVLVVTADATAA